MNRWLNAIARRGIAVVALAIAGTGCSVVTPRGASPSAPPRGLPETSSAPGAVFDPDENTLGSVTDREGHTHDLDADLRAGKKVVLVFWQSWCPPCRREAPGLQKASVDYSEKLTFYGVITGTDRDVSEPAVTEFIADAGLDYPQIRDRDATWWKRYHVKGTPTVIVIDSNGVLFRGHRPPNWAALVGQTATPIASTPDNADTAGPRLIERHRELGVMGTSLEITAIGQDAEKLDRAIDAAVAEMQRIEDMMTSWRTSPLNTLNDAAGHGPQTVPRELARLTARAVEIGRLTEGAFDVTFASVGKLWDFKADPPRLPSDQELASRLAHVDYRKVAVDVEKSRVTLPSGTRIGLGGIAKGYGVDRAMRVLLDHGVRHAVVNAGGDMKVLGQNFGKPWEVAIKHPRDPSRALALLRLSNTCLVTSGDYERFFELDGVRYHHIIDPRNGRPATGAMSATVVAQDAAFADALATALCVLGPAVGIPIIESLPRVEAVVIDLEGEIHVSTGLADLVEVPSTPEKRSS